MCRRTRIQKESIPELFGHPMRQPVVPGRKLGPHAAGYAADFTGSFVAPSNGAAAVLLLAALIGWQSGEAPQAATH